MPGGGDRELRWETPVEARDVQATGGGLRISDGVVSLTDKQGIKSYSMEDGTVCCYTGQP
jgi:hypothetical protein